MKIIPNLNRQEKELLAKIRKKNGSIYIEGEKNLIIARKLVTLGLLKSLTMVQDYTYVGLFSLNQ